MPDYVVTLTFVDELGGETTRRYTGTFADDGAATTAADNLVTDAAAISTARVNGVLSKELTGAGSAASGSRVFENLQAVVLKNDGEDFAMNVPSPVAAVFSGNAMIITATAWTNFVANFGSSLWKISDGEYPAATKRGKRIFVRSGKTNLP